MAKLMVVFRTTHVGVPVNMPIHLQDQEPSEHVRAIAEELNDKLAREYCGFYEVAELVDY